MAKVKWPAGVAAEVIWYDAISSSGWMEHFDKDSPSLCKSIGYVVSENASVLNLAQSQSVTTGHIAEVLSIPKREIIKRRRVR